MANLLPNYSNLCQFQEELTQHMNQLMPISRRTYTTHESLEHWQCRPGTSQETHALKQVY
jgi:hypothetical protein